MPNKAFPDRSRLLEGIAYCHLSGRVRWRNRPESHFPKGWSGTWNSRYAGSEIVRKDSNGYVRCAFDGVPYPVHRLVWHLLMGDIPDGAEIDHINGNRADNRLSNLRIVNDAQNGMNRGLSSRNKSGHAGVGYHKKRRVWFSNIRVDGRLIHIGYFKVKEAAVEARKVAEQKHFGQYARKMTDS